MYQMKKCVKCNSENIEEHYPLGSALQGIVGFSPDHSYYYTVYRCRDCGYLEITMVDFSETTKENKPADRMAVAKA